MIFRNAMSFKTKIKQLAKEKGITSQQVQQNYLIEVFLVKLAKSKYKDNFIIKGGYLIGGIVGLDNRATMDLDTTIKGFDLTPEILSKITKEIVETITDESFTLSFVDVEEIRETDDYPGYRLKLRATFEKISEIVAIDVTSGDIITPREVDFSFKQLFDDNKIELLSYPLETVLAEKIETILSRGIATTRPRDYYDIFILLKTQINMLNVLTIKQALENTMRKRASNFDILEYNAILNLVETSSFHIQLWEKYQHQFSYADAISFSEVISSVRELMKNVVESAESN